MGKRMAARAHADVMRFDALAAGCWIKQGAAPVAVSDTPQVTEVLAAEPAPHCFDADEIGIRWRRTACTQSVCPVQAALDKGSCLVKLGPGGYC